MVRHVLEQVLVQRLGRAEGRQAVGHEEPAPLRVGLVIVLLGLVGELAVDLVPQLLVPDPLVDDVVAQDLLLLPGELGVVHEAEDQLEDRQRLLVVALLGLRKEGGLYWLLAHLPEVGLEVDVGHLAEHVVVDVGGQAVVALQPLDPPRHLQKFLK